MSGSKPSGFRVASDKPFLIGLGVLGGSYLLIIGAMVLADLVFLNYSDRPVLGPEMVKQGRYTGDEVTVSVEPSRGYFFRKGKNDAGLQLGEQHIASDGLFRAAFGQAVLLPHASGRPITASLRPEARVLGIALKDRDPGLHLQVVKKFGAMESEFANKYLLGALKDPNPFVREKVLSVLGDRERTTAQTQSAQN